MSGTGLCWPLFGHYVCLPDIPGSPVKTSGGVEPLPVTPQGRGSPAVLYESGTTSSGFTAGPTLYNHIPCEVTTKRGRERERESEGGEGGGGGRGLLAWPDPLHNISCEVPPAY